MNLGHCKICLRPTTVCIYKDEVICKTCGANNYDKEFHATKCTKCFTMYCYMRGLGSTSIRGCCMNCLRSMECEGCGQQIVCFSLYATYATAWCMTCGDTYLGDLMYESMHPCLNCDHMCVVRELTAGTPLCCYKCIIMDDSPGEKEESKICMDCDAILIDGTCLNCSMRCVRCHAPSADRVCQSCTGRVIDGYHQPKYCINCRHPLGDLRTDKCVTCCTWCLKAVRQGVACKSCLWLDNCMNESLELRWHRWALEDLRKYPALRRLTTMFLIYSKTRWSKFLMRKILSYVVG